MTYRWTVSNRIAGSFYTHPAVRNLDRQFGTAARYVERVGGDRVDGDVAERRRVRHGRIVPVVPFPFREPISVRERDSGEGNVVMIGAARGRER